MQFTHQHKKLITLLLITTLLGILIIGGLVFKNIYFEDEVVVVAQESKQPIETVMKSKAVLSGKFKDHDLVHKGSGRAIVVEKDGKATLVFENFTTTNGPDLFVYLSPNPANDDLGDYVSLGRLQKTKGDQTYNLPTNYRDYKTVVVWCRAFSITFTTAELKSL